MSNYPLDTHREAMLGFKQKLYEIVGVIGSYESIAYLDYPIHLNTGDLLIMRGTEAFFSHFGIKPKIRKSVAAQSRTDGTVEGIIEGSTTIVFHGGGNLGDLYPLHDNFRKLVIKRYPNNKIVILPQTIHFSSKKNLESASEIYRSHSNLHLCVRDRVSFELASNYLSENVYLMPDMAHFLWPLAVPRVHEGSSKTLFLMRGTRSRPRSRLNFAQKSAASEIGMVCDLTVMSSLKHSVKNCAPLSGPPT
ncbi:polysaccharide pyruvyl transferase family protein [Cupriavidus necator]|nr:polysaccharide pyruvyl transferase family protein [Cupriavidus necator]